jgi:hypothetical protein
MNKKDMLLNVMDERRKKSRYRIVFEVEVNAQDYPEGITDDDLMELEGAVQDKLGASYITHRVGGWKGK